jgi:glyoxalase family protein
VALEGGIHHITAITADAPGNVDFYARALGLRLVKKTVNFDAPEAYHLYFGDETGAPGSILTWFEFPGVSRGRVGVGQIHTLQLGVASEEALDFWQQRVGGVRGEGSLRFPDYDGLQLELVVGSLGNPPLVDEDPDHLGEALRLPRQHEHLRGHLESALRPVQNPRLARA